MISVINRKTCYSVMITVGVAVAATGISSAYAQELKTINYLSANEGTCTMYPQFLMTAFGYLEKEGYEVNLLSSDTTVPYTAFLSNGDADIAQLDAAQVLMARASGYDVKVVYETHQYAPEGIVVLADSPIKKLEDLKGKKVGLAENSDEVTTQIALDSAGLALADVTAFVIGNQGPVMANALLGNQVDAFAGGNSDFAALEAQGVEFRNITPDAVSRNPGNSLVVWGPTLEEKRPMIQAFTRAWAAAQAAGPLDIKAIAAACATYVPEQFEDFELGMKAMNFATYVTLLRRTFHAGDLQPDVWADIQPGYIKAGLLTEEVDPATFLDTSFQAGVRSLTTEYIKEGIEKWKQENPEKVIP